MLIGGKGQRMVMPRGNTRTRKRKKCVGGIRQGKGILGGDGVSWGGDEEIFLRSLSTRMARKKKYIRLRVERGSGKKAGLSEWDREDRDSEMR